jgi:hypothetical protein
MLLFKCVRNKKHRLKRQLFKLGAVEHFVGFGDLRINHINLRICDLRTGTPKKFTELP